MSGYVHQKLRCNWMKRSKWRFFKMKDKLKWGSWVPYDKSFMKATTLSAINTIHCRNLRCLLYPGDRNRDHRILQYSHSENLVRSRCLVCICPSHKFLSLIKIELMKYYNYYNIDITANFFNKRKIIKSKFWKPGRILAELYSG